MLKNNGSEAVGVVDEACPFGVAAPLAARGVEHGGGVPAPSRHFAGCAVAGAQRAPERVRIGAGRIAAAEADDGDRLIRCRCAVHGRSQRRRLPASGAACGGASAGTWSANNLATLSACASAS